MESATVNYPTKFCKFHAQTTQIYIYSFNPITYRGRGGGGGGAFGPDHQIIDHNSKTAPSSTSKLADFLFLSIGHILAEFSQNRSITRGVAAIVSEMRRLEKLNIQSFLFRFKTMEMQRGL